MKRSITYVLGLLLVFLWLVGCERARIPTIGHTADPLPGTGGGSGPSDFRH